MSLPTNITSADQYDAGTKDPKQARAQLKGLHDDVVQINDHLKASPLLSPATPLGIGDGLESASGNLRVQLQANPGIARAASGLALDIEGLTALSSPAVGDLLAIRDASAGARRKITLEDLLKVIDALAEETAPDDADKLLLYDASGAVVKKVRADKIGGGGWETYGTDFSASQTSGSLDISAAFGSSYGEYEIYVEDLWVQPDNQIAAEVKTSSGWETTNTDYAMDKAVFRDGSTVSLVASHFQSTKRVDLFNLSASDNINGAGWLGTINIRNANETDAITIIDCHGIYRSGGLSTPYQIRSRFYFKPARAITGFRFIADAGNLDCDRVRVRRRQYTGG